MVMPSDFNKALCLFLQNVIHIFETPNEKLQSRVPHIHMLRSILLDMFRNLLLRFVLPSVITSSTCLLDIKYQNKENQKSDSDIIIGHSASKVVENLKPNEKVLFFNIIRNYFIGVCNYMRLKFPFNDEVLIKSEVASLEKIESASFSDLKYFLDKFPALLNLFSDADVDTSLDILQSQFCTLQVESIPENIKSCVRIDTQWSLIGKMKDSLGICKYDLLSKVMLAVLTIPHSNAECERVFSMVTKNHNQFRPTLSTSTLEELLILKSNLKGNCFEQNFSSSVLKRAKTATVNSLKK